MGDFPNVNVPSYLLDMKQQVNRYEAYLTHATKALVAKSPSSRPAKYYRRLVDKGLLLLVAYRSNIPNATYVLTADLKNLLAALKAKHYDIKEDETKFLQNRLTVLILPIFGKSNHANKCVHCS